MHCRAQAVEPAVLEAAQPVTWQQEASEGDSSEGDSSQGVLACFSKAVRAHSN